MCLEAGNEITYAKYFALVRALRGHGDDTRRIDLAAPQLNLSTGLATTRPWQLQKRNLRSQPRQTEARPRHSLHRENLTAASGFIESIAKRVWCCVSPGRVTSKAEVVC